MAQQQVGWGDPTPAALFAVGAGTTAVWALLTGRVGMQDLHIFVAWLMAAAFILIIAGLISFARADPVSGSLNLTFGALFFGAPALTYAFLLWGTPKDFLALLAAIGITGLPGITINGWVYILLGIILCVFIPILARQSWLFLVALVVFAIGVFMLAAYTLQGFPPPTPMWGLVGVISAWLIVLGGLIMAYIGMATALLYGLGRMVLPIPGPLG